jgi:hypothetical protein
MSKIHPPLPKDDAKTIDQAIQKIRFDDIENLYIFKNDKQIRRFRGTGTDVSPESFYLLEMKDSIVVHNHPQGTSLSLEDLEAIVKFDAKELIIVTKAYLFIVTRPFRGWNIVFDGSFQERYSISSSMAESLLDKEIAKNEITLFDKEIEKIHYIWAYLFQFYDVKYKKKAL